MEDVGESMSVVFDGRGYAKEIEEQLIDEVKSFVEKHGRRPKLVTVMDSNNLSSVAYTKVKEKFAERIGVEFEVFEEPEIEKWNKDKTVDGIMIQLPYPNSQFLIDIIDINKDVDGLREDSLFLPATVCAVVEIVKVAGVKEADKIVVVGNRGEVGKRLEKVLRANGMDKEDFDSSALLGAHVAISCTGVAGLIKSDMVREGVVAIDVGYPKGDFDPGVAEKASFFTPVPGGVGPVTVAMLFKNLINAN